MRAGNRSQPVNKPTIPVRQFLLQIKLEIGKTKHILPDIAFEHIPKRFTNLVMRNTCTRQLCNFRCKPHCIIHAPEIAPYHRGFNLQQSFVEFTRNSHNTPFSIAVEFYGNYYIPLSKANSLHFFMVMLWNRRLVSLILTK